MAKVILPGGQEIEIPDRVAAKDKALRSALSMSIPDIYSADLKRESENDSMIARVIYKADDYITSEHHDALVRQVLDGLVAIEADITVSGSVRRQTLEHLYYQIEEMLDGFDGDDCERTKE